MIKGKLFVVNALDVKKMISILCSSPALPFFFSALVSLDFPCMAHAFFPELLSIRCQGLPISAQNVVLFVCRIHRKIASGQKHDSK
jgi:hypothetical protein